ncbi:MAG: hypothetical protein QNJ51_26045 [Calothrix sp. MO_167.B12]|nr:hypothetical protein [Calothrix sp. MO_167.B12]
MEASTFSIDELLKSDSTNGSIEKNNGKTIDEVSLDTISKTFASAPIETIALEADSLELKASDSFKPIPIPIRPLPPTRVFGKEYSDNADKTTSGMPDPGQTLLWNGTGATRDGIDYRTSGQVDAMANPGDAYFYSLINDRVAMVFSTTFDDKIYYERPGAAQGGIWATSKQIDAPGPGMDQGVHDVDALELWGPDNRSDAFYYSVYGDVTFDPLTGQVASGAVLDQNNNVIFTRQEIAKAVGNATGLDAQQLLGYVNVDAMMVSGKRIVFSVDPIEKSDLNGTGFLDGGEIFVYDQTTGRSSFLKHGGHLWDTAFDVKGTFGTATENINALEAVPLDRFLVDSISADTTLVSADTTFAVDSTVAI